MFAFGVFHRDEVGSPFIVGEGEAEVGGSVGACPEGEGFDGFVVGIGYIIGQLAVVGAPPPVPIDFVDLHLEFGVYRSLAGVIDGGNGVGVVRSGVQLFLILLGRLDAGVARIWGIERPVGVDAEIAGFFIDAGHEVGEQHARG